MNYPVWDVAFGAGLLIAIVSILHVFVSHFAVGGGLFLVLTERRALRRGDTALAAWLKSHTRFFVLVTVVFGAVSGVGIWFTIALINPTATSNLIHAYVWGWAIEWVFFFLEITAALLYMYGWDKLEPRRHMWYGWVYFLAAFASMVIINGIVTFMLTPGQWIQTHDFWTGFFNPTYFPSLAARFTIALALAGIYALITASVQPDAGLKARIVKWSAVWIVPAFLVLPLFLWWYARSIPVELWTSARGAMPTATRFAQLAMLLSVATCVVAAVALLRPSRLRLGVSLLVAMLALGAMGSLEFVREAVRKPFAIAHYLYGNSLYARPMPGDGGFTVEHIDRAGILATAKWVDVHTDAAGAAAGREIFRVECESCHTADAYRGVKRFLALRNWDRETLQAMLGSLDAMHNRVMPPFAGTDAERRALAAYLGTVYQAQASPGPPNGEQVFTRNCAPCHRLQPRDSVFTILPAVDPQSAADALKDLHGLFPGMPPLQLADPDRAALVRWIDTRFPAGARTQSR